MLEQDKQQELLTAIGKHLESAMVQAASVTSQTTMFVFFGVTVTPQQNQVQYSIIGNTSCSVGGTTVGTTTPESSTLRLPGMQVFISFHPSVPPISVCTVDASFTTDFKGRQAEATFTLTPTVSWFPSGTFSVVVGNWAIIS